MTRGGALPGRDAIPRGLAVREEDAEGGTCG